MFKGYAENDLHREVVDLFRKMKNLDILPNVFTFPMILKSCVKIGTLKEGEEVHCIVVKIGFRSNSYVGTTLIDLYSGGRSVQSAYTVFGEMTERNVVAWNSMISGFIICGDIISARKLFELAPERDVILWNTIISGYIEVRDMKEARKLFDRMPNKDIMSWNRVLNGYANNGDTEALVKLFDEMPEKNVFSWNGLIGGYSKNGCFSEVLDVFKRMLVDGKVVPNDATLVTVLSACARLGALDMGKWVHIYAENNGYKGNLYVGNSLIDLYTKCGEIEIAVDIFNSMEQKDLISWNTMIGGLGMHGRGTDALSLFHQMKNAGVKPDGITFVNILCTCMHMGLVEDGFSYFDSMTNDYLIMPQIEHYGCMVDLLSRAGLLTRAVEFVKKMPIKADAVIWAALLGASRVHKNIDVAEMALERLTEFEPNNPANYVMLSNIYGDLGRWRDVARLKVAMRDTGVKKIPGCSLIEVNDCLVEFYSLDERHSQSEDIYIALRGLTKLCTASGDVLHFQELEELGCQR